MIDVARSMLPEDVPHMVKYVTTVAKRTIMHSNVKTNRAKFMQWMRVTDEFYVDVVTEQNTDKKDWMLTMKVNDTHIALKLDIGAEANVMSEATFNNIRPRPKVHATKMKVRGYSGTAIPVKGRCLVEVTHKDRERTLAFVVVHRDVQAKLGLAACERLNLVKRVLVVESEGETVYDELMEEYSDLFQGLGCLPGEHTIRVDKNLPPVINPCRKKCHLLFNSH